MTTGRRPRVLLADDCAEFLTALERLLASSCEVVGHARDVGALIDEARRLEPDVIVVDLFMPPGNGVDACRRRPVRSVSRHHRTPPRECRAPGVALALLCGECYPRTVRATAEEAT